MGTYLDLVDGLPKQKNAIDTTAGVADANKIIKSDSTGKLNASFLPAGVGPDIKNIEASENLGAGDFVNIWNDGGTPKVRLADASALGKEVTGYVLAAVTAAALAEVYFEGINDQLTGLTSGVTYWLDTTPGQVTNTPPSGSGEVVQIIGKSLSTTEISFEKDLPYELA